MLNAAAVRNSRTGISGTPVMSAIRAAPLRKRRFLKRSTVPCGKIATSSPASSNRLARRIALLSPTPRLMGIAPNASSRFRQARLPELRAGDEADGRSVVSTTSAGSIDDSWFAAIRPPPASGMLLAPSTSTQ